MLALGIVACDGRTPTRPSDPPVPPVVNNTPPAIAEIKISSERVEADEEVELTASVKDDETALDQLTYVWAASPAAGTFSGNGPIVKWRAPKQQTTPDVYTFTLTITERFMSAGEARENKVVSSPVMVRYNDSAAEVLDLAMQFYQDFGTFSVSPEQCVRNFSDNCSGKRDELSDIRNNRLTTHILSSTFTATSITFNGTPRITGTVRGPCTFEDIPNATGRRQNVSGECLLTTVYEEWRWYLCVSRFLNGGTTPAGNLRYRVPGRIIP